ncbi:MAG: quinone-dependent dihydroorotate dehydrogenase, partial [Puniceicoccaceae bacterium]
MLYETLLRPLLFRLDPEKAHEWAVDGLRLLSLPAVRWAARALLRLPAGARPVRLFGLDFPNRVGLAAGFDKNGVCWRGAGALGFGHVEIGTVTYRRQPGNERPRVFRYPEAEALVNRMGFNNEGAEAVAARLRRRPRSGGPVLGINLGKSRTVGLDEAVEDYLGSFRLLADAADYIAINVSSPNTPQLRQLQESDRLAELLGALGEENRGRAGRSGEAAVPLLLKIAPDLDFRAIGTILGLALEHGLAGIIATNTTLARTGVPAASDQAGGLSGRPLRTRSTEIIRFIRRECGGRL